LAHLSSSCRCCPWFDLQGARGPPKQYAPGILRVKISASGITTGLASCYQANSNAEFRQRQRDCMRYYYQGPLIARRAIHSKGHSPRSLPTTATPTTTTTTTMMIMMTHLTRGRGSVDGSGLVGDGWYGTAKIEQQV
jgi:hypothetical protein